MDEGLTKKCVWITSKPEYITSSSELPKTRARQIAEKISAALSSQDRYKPEVKIIEAVLNKYAEGEWVVNTGKIEEALDLQNVVIERLRKIINKTHPEPIEATISLALVCKCYKEALEELYKE